MTAAAARLLERFVCRLRESGNAVAADPAVLDAVQARARRVVDDVAASLAAGRMSVADDPVAPSRGFDGLGRSGLVHPVEVQRALQLLFAVVLDGVVSAVGTGAEAPGLVALGALVLDASIGATVRDLAAEQTGLLQAKVATAHEAERRRISREIHDRIAIGIATMLRHMELWRAHADSAGREAAAAARQHCETAGALARASLADLRAVVSGLRFDPDLADIDDELRAYATSFGPPGVASSVVVIGDERSLPRQLRVELCLAVREAMRNAFVHSGARRVSTRIEVSPHRVEALVEDDGCGPPEGLGGGRCGGLTIMRERIDLIGGVMSVEPRPHGGTRVRFRIWLSCSEGARCTHRSSPSVAE